MREKEKKKEKFKTVDIIFHTTVCAGSARDLGACDFYFTFEDCRLFLVSASLFLGGA